MFSTTLNSLFTIKSFFLNQIVNFYAVSEKFWEKNRMAKRKNRLYLHFLKTFLKPCCLLRNLLQCKNQLSGKCDAVVGLQTCIQTKIISLVWA